MEVLRTTGTRNGRSQPLFESGSCGMTKMCRFLYLLISVSPAVSRMVPPDIKGYCNLFTQADMQGHQQQLKNSVPCNQHFSNCGL